MEKKFYFVNIVNDQKKSVQRFPIRRHSVAFALMGSLFEMGIPVYVTECTGRMPNHSLVTYFND